MAEASPASFAVEEGPDGSVLDVHGDWTVEAQRVVETGSVDGLRLNYARGFRERTLDFLGPWPLRRVEILARTITDVTPLYRLSSTLEHLSLTVSPRAGVDLSALPRLRSLSADWSQVADTIDSIQALQNLFLLGYDGSDLRALSGLTSLQSLRLKEISQLRSLDGAELLSRLQRLHVIGARHLEGVGALFALADTVRDLNLETSLGRVASLDGFDALTALQQLNIANCGLLASLHPLAFCADLERLYAYESTRISDGDLSVLLQLPKLRDLRMMNRSHYKPTVREIRAALG